MALVYHTLNLEVTPGSPPPTLCVSEYDINRQIDITLTQNGALFEIPSGTTAEVEGTIGKHGFNKSATINGSVVSFKLSKDMTAIRGRAWTKIKLTKDNEPISTCGFWLECDKAGLSAETVIGADGFEDKITNAVDSYVERNNIFYGVIVDGSQDYILELKGVEGTIELEYMTDQDVENLWNDTNDTPST